MIKFTPVKKVANAMPPSERSRTAALLNVRTEPGAEDTIKFLLDVAFQAVPVKRPFHRGHWFVACRSAMVTLQTSDGKVLGHTKEISEEFEYKNENSTGWEIGAEIKPTAKVGVGGADVEVGGVGVDAKKKKKHVGEYGYTGKENLLSVTGYENSVVWDFSMVRGEHAISDFLFCNLPLWADCKPQAKPLHGTIELLPSIFDFDQDKRKMSEVGSFLMQITLAFRKAFRTSPEKAPILNQDGITLSFGESQ